jgi:hypothetical protein
MEDGRLARPHISEVENLVKPPAATFSRQAADYNHKIIIQIVS